MIFHLRLHYLTCLPTETFPMNFLVSCLWALTRLTNLKYQPRYFNCFVFATTYLIHLRYWRWKRIFLRAVDKHVPDYMTSHSFRITAVRTSSRVEPCCLNSRIIRLQFCCVSLQENTNVGKSGHRNPANKPSTYSWTPCCCWYPWLSWHWPIRWSSRSCGKVYEGRSGTTHHFAGSVSTDNVSYPLLTITLLDPTLWIRLVFLTMTSRACMVRGASGDEWRNSFGARAQWAFGCSAEKAPLSDL